MAAAAYAFLEVAFGLLAGWLLVRRQVSRSNPLLLLDLMRRPIFSLSVAASTFSFAAQSTAFVTLPFYLERELGLSWGGTGLLMTPWPLTVALVAPVQPAGLPHRYSPGYGRDRPSADGGRAHGACVAAGRSCALEHCLAHVPMRGRIRPVQLAEQPDDDRLRAAVAGGRRERDASDEPVAGPDQGTALVALRFRPARRRGRSPRRSAWPPASPSSPASRACCGRGEARSTERWLKRQRAGEERHPSGHRFRRARESGLGTA